MSRADWPRAGRDPWTGLGLLGAWLALSIVFVHLPATIWAGNVAEFDFHVTSFLVSGLGALVVGVLVVGAVLAVLPLAPRRVVAAGLGATGLLAWGYGDLFVTPMGVLDGRDPPTLFDTRLGAWELALVGVLGVAIAVVIRRARRPAAAALLVLNVALAITSTITLVQARGRPLKAPPTARDEGVFRFSPVSNLLVVLLDGLQSDIADRALRADPALARRFEGFSFYHDAVAAAPTTFLNVPAIHSGEVYRLGQSLPAYFDDAIAHRSFMTRFAEAGYDTALVNPIEGVCPDRVDTCTSTARLMRSRAALLRLETFRLLDLSLFRVAPVWLKRRIYNGGGWLSAGRVPDKARIGAAEVNREFEVDQVLESLRFFDEVARRLTFNGGRPTLKFFHTFASHPPYLLDDSCHVTDAGLEHVTSQARCAFLAVATLLDRLRRADIYDRSVVLILADHGVNLVGLFHDDAPGSPLRWEHLAGAAHPLFLLKPRGARGGLRDASAAVHVADVGATLCAATGACTAGAGIPAGQAPPDRARRFYEYVWKHEVLAETRRAGPDAARHSRPGLGSERLVST